MATVDVKLDDKVELTLPANENDYIYILRQVAGGGFSITDYKIKVSNLIGGALPYTDDSQISAPVEGTQYFNTTDKTLRSYDGSTWRNLYNNDYEINITLDSSDIKNLGTTPINLIPAQGAGKYICITDYFYKWNYGSVPFDNNDILLKIDGSPSFSILVSSSVVSGTSDYTYFSNDPNIKTNENSLLKIQGTDSVDNGDSTLDIVMTYKIISL